MTKMTLKTILGVFMSLNIPLKEELASEVQNFFRYKNKVKKDDIVHAMLDYLAKSACPSALQIKKYNIDPDLILLIQQDLLSRRSYELSTYLHEHKDDFYAESTDLGYSSLSWVFYQRFRQEYIKANPFVEKALLDIKLKPLQSGNPKGATQKHLNEPDEWAAFIFDSYLRLQELTNTQSVKSLPAATDSKTTALPPPEQTL
jgi:hypothetical protein